MALDTFWLDAGEPCFTRNTEYEPEMESQFSDGTIVRWRADDWAALVHPSVLIVGSRYTVRRRAFRDTSRGKLHLDMATETRNVCDRYGRID